MTYPTQLKSLVVRGRRYKVCEQLSVAWRGRWKVYHSSPRPRGTTYTAIILPESAEADQLRRSIARIPADQHSLPKLVDWETVAGQTTLVITWCAGKSVADYYKRFRSDDRSPISVWEAIRRTTSMAHALSDLHTYAGVIHADIKPANLIIPSDPGSLFLIDFGSGWQIERTAARSAGDGWNAVYSSPEIFQELDAVDARADQFSLGVVLFEMLTGKPPYAGFGGKAGHRGFESVANSFVAPSKFIASNEIPKSILREIDEVVGRTLKFNPCERFGNTREFAQALGSIWQSLRAKSDNMSKHKTVAQTVWDWFSR